MGYLCPIHICWTCMHACMLSSNQTVTYSFLPGKLPGNNSATLLYTNDPSLTPCLDPTLVLEMLRNFLISSRGISRNILGGEPVRDGSSSESMALSKFSSSPTSSENNLDCSPVTERWNCHAVLWLARVIVTFDYRIKPAHYPISGSMPCTPSIPMHVDYTTPCP